MKVKGYRFSEDESAFSELFFKEDYIIIGNTPTSYDYNPSSSYKKIFENIGRNLSVNIRITTNNTFGTFYIYLNPIQKFRLNWLNKNTLLQRDIYQILPLAISGIALILSAVQYYNSSASDKELLEAKDKINVVSAHLRVLEFRDSLEKAHQ